MRVLHGTIQTLGKFWRVCFYRTCLWFYGVNGHRVACHGKYTCKAEVVTEHQSPCPSHSAVVCQLHTHTSEIISNHLPRHNMTSHHFKFHHIASHFITNVVSYPCKNHSVSLPQILEGQLKKNSRIAARVLVFFGICYPLGPKALNQNAMRPRFETLPVGR